MPLTVAKTAAARPLDEARRRPIDRIERAASALIVGRIVRVGRAPGRSAVTSSSSGD